MSDDRIGLQLLHPCHHDGTSAHSFEGFGEQKSCHPAGRDNADILERSSAMIGKHSFPRLVKAIGMPLSPFALPEMFFWC